MTTKVTNLNIDTTTITSVGTLTSLNVTGNISSGNASLGNLVTGNYFAGNILTDHLLYSNGSAWSLGGGGSGTPGGSNTQVQFNDANAFGGSANLTFNKTTNTLGVTTANVTTLNASNVTVTGTLTTGAGSGGNISGVNTLTATTLNASTLNATTVTATSVAGTLTTASHPNITSVGTLTSLTSNGTVDFTNTSNVSLGSSANIHITGGTSGYALITDGSGNLSWATTVPTAGANNIGYLNIPQNSQSADYSILLSDAGKHIYHADTDTTARTWTIPSNANVAFPTGSTLIFVNDSSGVNVTVAIDTDTLLLAGNGATGSRTLAANGMATAVKLTSTKWMISGVGLT